MDRQAVPAPVQDDPGGLLAARSVFAAPRDRRGKHEKRPNKVDAVRRQSVFNHINSFPRYVSHYRRNNAPDRRYITAVGSLAALYREYLRYCGNAGITPVQEHLYRGIFYTKFNISFRVPQQDTCKVCDAAAVRGREAPSAEELRMHQERAEFAQNSFKEDKRRCRQPGSNIACMTMDLQQALPTPKIETSEVFYLRKLWTYNFGIHYCNDETAAMCVWPEFVAGRGADEIGSCLLQALNVERLAGENRHLIMWSDCCVGQNKNFKIACLWLYMVENQIFDTIEHKFFIPGHSMMDSDRDFGLIEQAKRKRRYIYTHHEWMDLIENARQRKKFKVQHMTSANMYDLSVIERLFDKTKRCVEGSAMRLRDISAIKVSRFQPNTVYVRYNDDVNRWIRFNVGRRNNPSAIRPVLNSLPRKYPRGKPVKAEKIADIKKMLKDYIPAHFADYFGVLCSSTSEAEDYLVSDETQEEW